MSFELSRVSRPNRKITQFLMEERTIGGQTQRKDEDLEDRISALPDELIHDIMDRLPIANRAAKLIFLSKRWNHLWLSHPIVKFDEIEFLRFFNDGSFYKRAVKEFANAVLRKLSQREADTTVVRITVSWRKWGSKLCSRFLDDILDRLAAKKVPSSLQEIDFRFGRAFHFKENPVNYPAYNIPLGLLKFDRLRILKLAYCDFRLYTSDSDNNNPFPGFGSCLELLDLDRVSFPNGRILNNMIASAARLKTLILNSVFGIGRFQVRNHPNLKVLRANRLIGDIVEITGAQSLETLRLTDWEKGELQISSMPNLKVLHIENTEGHQLITVNELRKLIPEFPSVESITLEYFPPMKKLQIFSSDKVQEIRFFLSEVVDAVRLINFVHNVVDHLFPRVTHSINEAANQSDVVSMDIYCILGHQVNCQPLKQFLRKLSQFRVFLEFYFYCPDLWYLQAQGKDELPTPIVESVRLPSLNRSPCCILDTLLESCHPKILYVTGKGIERYHKPVQDVCEELMERSCNDDCTSACECWRHQLKSVKIIKKVSNGEINEDEEIEISEDVILSLVDKEQITLRLTWN